MIDDSGRTSMVIGPPGPLRLAHFVATSEPKEQRDGGSCGPDSENGLGAGSSYPRVNEVLEVLEVLIYDARTGAEAGRKLFDGKTGECPTAVTVELAGGGRR